MSQIKDLLLNKEKIFETEYLSPMIMDFGTIIEVTIGQNHRIIHNEVKTTLARPEQLYDRLWKILEEISSKRK